MACLTSAVPSDCLQPSASQPAKQVRGLDFSGYLIADLAGTRSIQPNLHFKYCMYICSMFGFWHRSDVYFRLQDSSSVFCVAQVDSHLMPCSNVFIHITVLTAVGIIYQIICQPFSCNS